MKIIIEMTVLNDGASCATDLVFEIGEVLVFRGADGLPFNLLKITENVSRASIQWTTI